MNIIEAIKRRRTIRKFKQQPIEEDILINLVDLARRAPSAANLQPLEYVIVNNKKICEKIFPHLKWAAYIAPEGNPKEGEQPVAYIIVLVNKNRTTTHAQVDSGAAIENILLGAMEYGIGGCWIGSINREEVGKIININQNYEILYIIALGYPAETPVMEDTIDDIKYYKDDKGILHVPKRKLEVILHKEKIL